VRTLEPLVRYRFQRLAIITCLSALLLSNVRLLSPGVYVDFWRIEFPALLGILFASTSIVLAVSSTDKRHRWLMLIAASDALIVMWCLAPMMGNNY
jgi:Ni/Fe-hydrogenase subunit HybB-like protein